MNTKSNVIEHLSKRLTFKKGEYIFKKGMPRDDAFIIVDGNVAIITSSVSGAEQIASMLSEGDIFGEMALMEPGERTAAARAVADTEVYAISRAAIKDRMTNLDPVLGTLFALLVDRYRKTRIYIPESAELPDPEQVVAHLKKMAEQDRQTGKIEVVPEILVDLGNHNMEAIQELGLEQKISEGLKNDEFKPFLQPIYEMKKQKVIGYEALARWLRKDGEMIPPFEFIPAAERLNMIHHIDFAIFDQVCELAKQCQDRLRPGDTMPFFSINLSGKHFEDDILPGVVKSTIEDYGVDISALRFEVTESALIKDPERAKRLLTQLKDMGAAIALDDFGTGYSSLSYLHKFPIDTIKIDRSFVMQIRSETKSVDIIKAIVAIAESFKIDVIAEGIESEVEMHTLRSIGCHIGQGYYFGRPAPADEAIESYFSDAA